MAADDCLKLKPCAHCGSEGEFTYTGISYRGFFVTLRCTNRNCGCSFSQWVDGGVPKFDACDTVGAEWLTKRWNRRWKSGG